MKNYSDGHPGESRGPGPGGTRSVASIAWIPAFAGMTGLLAGVGVYWAWTLFGNFQYRALFTADPLMQMVNAQMSVDAFQRGSWWQWLASFMQDETARPLLNALLSLGPISGLAGGISYHYMVTGFFSVLFFVISAAVVWKWMGRIPAFIFSALMIGSNLILEYVLEGGHGWIGQAFLWSALLAIRLEDRGWRLEEKQKPNLQPLSSNLQLFLFGLLLSLACMSSYHMIPIAGVVFGLFCLQRAGAGTKAGQGLDSRMKAIAWGLAGAVALPAILMLVTFPNVKQLYPAILAQNMLWAKTSGGQFPAGPDFFPRLLAYGESWIFLLIFGAAALAGGWFLAQEVKRWTSGTPRNDHGAAFFLITPIALYAFWEMTGVVKLGRGYVLLLPFLFAWAAWGIAALLEKIPLGRHPGESRDPDLKLDSGFRRNDGMEIAKILITGCFIVTALAPNWSKRAKTNEAFHAGKKIAAILREQGSLRPPIIAGFHMPHVYLHHEEHASMLRPERLLRARSTGQYFYLPNLQERVITRTDLKKTIRGEGENVWVLVSYYSSWNWQSFMEDDDPNVIPVKKFYASNAPFIPAPGTETTDHQIFSNEAIYSKIRKGIIPWPIENRLYRGKDLLPFLENDGAKERWSDGAMER